jgi:hypothetical protein
VSFENIVSQKMFGCVDMKFLNVAKLTAISNKYSVCVAQ